MSFQRVKHCRFPLKTGLTVLFTQNTIRHSPLQHICARCRSCLGNQSILFRSRKPRLVNIIQTKYQSTGGKLRNGNWSYMIGGIVIGSITTHLVLNYVMRDKRKISVNEPIDVQPHPLAVQAQLVEERAANEESTSHKEESTAKKVKGTSKKEKSKSKEKAETSNKKDESNEDKTFNLNKEDSAAQEGEMKTSEGDDEEEIPSYIPYLIIGGGPATVGAYITIKVSDPKAKILVVSQEKTSPYYRPPLSKELWYEKNRELARSYSYMDIRRENVRNVFFEPKGFYFTPKDLMKNENGGVGLLLQTKVLELNPSKKTVLLDNGKEIRFDKCLIATGGKPRNLPVIEKASQEVKDRTLLFRTIKDYSALDAVSENAKSIAVIGGGFLGSELTTALRFQGLATGLKVTQIFPEEGHLGRLLPKYLSQWTSKMIRKLGVDVISNSTVECADFQDGKVLLSLSNGDKVSVDNVVVAVGIEPNIELAKKSGLEIDDKHGGIKVNAEFQASSDIWAAGDVASFYDNKFGRRRLEHFAHALNSGRLAGENMTGAAKPFKNQTMFWSDLGPEISLEAVGIIDSKLETVGVFERQTSVKTEDQQQEGEKSAEQTSLEIPDNDDYSKGIVFYLKDKEIVGILLWNLFYKERLAKKLLKYGAQNEDLYEIAKLFYKDMEE